METLERYNELLRTNEDETMQMLDRVLESSFQRLVRRTRIHIKAGYSDPAQRNLALLQEFRQLVPAFNPERVDAYDRILRNLLGTSSRYGLGVAEELTGFAQTARPRVDVSIPLEATAAAAAQARGYLQRHGDQFAETAARTVAQGIAEGRPTDAVIQDMRDRLGVVKSRADVIVRTESLRAYNQASDQYYAAQGIDLVMYYATADDRSCEFCVPPAGQIFKRGAVRVPRHPRCRCYLAPWNSDIEQLDPSYVAMRKTHKRQVEASSPFQSPEGVSLNKPAQFEQIAPVPIS